MQSHIHKEVFNLVSLEIIMQRMEKYGRFNNLHPAVKEGAKKLIEQSYAKGIPIQITQGFRSFKEQNDLYAIGRTINGKKVTNAKGGQSYHNYGLAIDFVLLSSDGNTALWTVNNKWLAVAAIGKSLGFKWGGDWTSFKDYPHLEMTFGLSIDDLQSGRRPANTAKPNENPGSSNLLKVGSEGDDVKSLQKDLNRLGAKIEEDGIYGKGTKEAVQDFQKEYKLDDDGIAGSKTLSKLASVIKEKISKAIPDYPGSLIKLGSQGKDVERIQRAVGIPEKEVDGRYGPDTVKAVKAYQKRKGLFVDGTVGKKTWEMMF